MKKEIKLTNGIKNPILFKEWFVFTVMLIVLSSIASATLYFTLNLFFDSNKGLYYKVNKDRVWIWEESENELRVIYDGTERYRITCDVPKCKINYKFK